MYVFIKSRYLLLLIYLLSASCGAPSEPPLFPKDLTNKNERENTLFAFVGEKIKFEVLPRKPQAFNTGIKAKYKILQRIYGSYDGDTIEFEAYDHYGIPPFTQYKNALLYLSKDQNVKYYQEKYQFNDVYMTLDGRWAGSYSEDYGHVYNKTTAIKPEKIEFIQKVGYPTKGKNDDGIEYTLSFPEPYFNTINDTAYAVYGNYVEELFKLKRDGVFVSRELFGDHVEKEKEARRLELIEIQKTYTREDLDFIAFWKSLAASIKNGVRENFLKVTLDSISNCGVVQSKERFAAECYYKIFNYELKSWFDDALNVRYNSGKDDMYTILSSARKIVVEEEDEKFTIREVELIKPFGKENSYTLYLSFISTRNGYRFYGCNYFEYTNCCNYHR